MLLQARMLCRRAPMAGMFFGRVCVCVCAPARRMLPCSTSVEQVPLALCRHMCLQVLVFDELGPRVQVCPARQHAAVQAPALCTFYLCGPCSTQHLRLRVRSHPQVNHVVELIRASPESPVAFTVQRTAPGLVGEDSAITTAATARMALEASSSGNFGSLGPVVETRVVRVTPEIGPDGAGRIGVRLNSNAVIKHRRAQVGDTCAWRRAALKGAKLRAPG